MLSTGQFGEFAQNVRQGGDSVHVVTGERPRTGYMVSLPDRETRVPLPEFGAHSAVAYTRRHGEELHDPDQYLGGWAHGSEAFLDVSRRYADEPTALTEGWKANQIAVHRNDDHEDIDVPLSPRDLPIWRDS